MTSPETEQHSEFVVPLCFVASGEVLAAAGVVACSVETYLAAASPVVGSSASVVHQHQPLHDLPCEPYLAFLDALAAVPFAVADHPVTGHSYDWLGLVSPADQVPYSLQIEATEEMAVDYQATQSIF